MSGIRAIEKIVAQGERAVRRRFVAVDRRVFRQGGQGAT